MIYKLANDTDMYSLPPMDEKTWDTLFEFAKILSSEYGRERNVDTDDGGYVLYATHGTTAEEVRTWFDYTKWQVEYVNRTYGDPPVCSALYLLSNDFGVVIVMSIDDAPPEIRSEFEEGY